MGCMGHQYGGIHGEWHRQEDVTESDNLLSIMKCIANKQLQRYVAKGMNELTKR